jgi:hypothetical protein
MTNGTSAILSEMVYIEKPLGGYYIVLAQVEPIVVKL